MPSLPRAHRFAPLAIVLLAYVALAVGFQRSVPLFEAPDEPSHLQYVGFLSQEQALPRYGEDPEVPGEGMQPPLYYVLSVPLYRWLTGDDATLLGELHRINLMIYGNVRLSDGSAGRIQVRRRARGWSLFRTSPELSRLRHMRWPSLVFGLVAVFFTYRAALRASQDPRLAVLCAGTLALTPQFLFASGYVSNDTAATAVGAAIFWLVADAMRAPTGSCLRHYLLFSLVGAIALVTKNSVLPVLAIAGLFVFLVDDRPLRRRISNAALSGVVLIGLAGPYLVWNTAQRGDPLGMGAVWLSATHMNTYASHGGALSYFTGTYWTWTFQSYWGRFGWMNARAPDALYLSYLALTGIGIVGFVRGGRPPRAPEARDAAWRHFLVAAILATFAAHVWLNLHTAQPQGRHLFPVAPQIAYVLSIGFARVWGPSDLHASWRRTVLVLSGLCALAAYCLFGVVVPGYAPSAP